MVQLGIQANHLVTLCYSRWILKFDAILHCLYPYSEAQAAYHLCQAISHTLVISFFVRVLALINQIQLLEEGQPSVRIMINAYNDILIEIPFVLFCVSTKPMIAGTEDNTRKYQPGAVSTRPVLRGFVQRLRVNNFGIARRKQLLYFISLWSGQSEGFLFLTK